MFEAMNLFVGIVAGAFGMAYFIYGKKQGRMLFMGAGIALMIYPYLLSNLFALVAVGLVLLAAPLLYRG